MRVVLQRVSRAEVRIGDRVSGSIGRGYVLLVAFRHDDDDRALEWMARKILALRLFPDTGDATAGGHAQSAAADTQGEVAPGGSTGPDGRTSSFSRDVLEVDGALLVVSQFTLYGDARKGRRPGFSDAAPPDVAIPLYDRFVAMLEARAPGRVATGEFGAMMDVDLVNDGPVTLILDRTSQS